MGTATVMGVVVAAAISMVVMRGMATATAQTTETAMALGTSTDLMWHLSGAVWWEDDSNYDTYEEGAVFYFMELGSHYDGDFYGNGSVYSGGPRVPGNGFHIYRRIICK